MKTAARREYLRRWTRENYVSLTGFKLKREGYYRDYATNHIYLISERCFLSTDYDTQFFVAWDYPGRLFPIPRCDIKGMAKKNFNKKNYDTLFAAGHFAKPPIPRTNKRNRQ